MTTQIMDILNGLNEEETAILYYYALILKTLRTEQHRRDLLHSKYQIKL